MNVNQKWRRLGWRHPLWDYIRFYSVIQKQKKEVREEWKAKLLNNSMEIDEAHSLPVPSDHVKLFFNYLTYRDSDLAAAMGLLRTEEEALAHCERIGAKVSKVRTQSQDHHQSSAAMVAAVSFITGEYCLALQRVFS